VRKAHNWRQKEMNATLVYRIFNQQRSKKCEYLSLFSFIFCTVFFNPWNFLSCELKWLAGIGIIRYCGHFQTIVPCSPVSVSRLCFSNTNRKATTAGRHRTRSDAKLVHFAFQSFTRHFSSVE
jgi:hypothetical protein